MANYAFVPIHYSVTNPNNVDLSKVNINFQANQSALMDKGLNILVEISTASIYVKSPTPAPLKKIQIYAHFDTGASRTSIDVGLARYLNLLQTGVGTVNTAGGKKLFPNFVSDISLVNTPLKSFVNLEIGSCDLSFNLKENAKYPSMDNFGLLIGRDMMARWHITWNGATSTVIISD
jgi:hypothetical protein